ncbi:MAG: Ig-like domain-containing protein [Lachnospiraceae bacterium]|nr:Ig-like domain-containing protein [Lachnospiraceae bacterium]
MKKILTILLCVLVGVCHFNHIDVSAKTSNIHTYTRSKSQSGFWIKNKNINLHIEDKRKIKLNYSNLKKQKIRFQSMNKKIATVNRKGVVTGKRPGKTIIKVYDRKKRIRKCKVKVTQGYTLSFPKTEIELVIGQMVNNQAIMSNVLNETIFYESSDESVATVDDEGNIIAKGVGKAIITAEGIQAKTQCTVTVVDNIYSDEGSFIAHRGYCEGKYIENTMDAFANAVQNGFQGIETDIRVTSDGEFVLSHDASIWERVYKCADVITDSAERSGNIAMLTYDQLYRLTKGKIVKLSDYLNYMRDKNVHLYLEIKTLVANNYPTMEMVTNEAGGNLLQKQKVYQVRKLLAMINEKGMTNQITITSFANDYLELVRKEDNIIAIQYIISKPDIDFEYLKKYNFGIDVPLNWVTPEEMQIYKQNQIRVCVYCADTREQMLYAISLKPDNITTNECLFVRR